MSERWLNLAMMLVGEALAEISNKRQIGRLPGADFAIASEKLKRASEILVREDNVVVTAPES